MGKKKVTKKTQVKKQAPETTPESDGWEIVGNVWDDIYLFENPGDTFEGIYLSSAADVGPNASHVHIFLVDKVRTGVWGSAALDQRMKSCKVGYQTRIRFDSLALAQKSGRSYRDFQVWQQDKPAPGYSEVSGDDIPF